MDSNLGEQLAEIGRSADVALQLPECQPGDGRLYLACTHLRHHHGQMGEKTISFRKQHWPSRNFGTTLIEQSLLQPDKAAGRGGGKGRIYEGGVHVGRAEQTNKRDSSPSDLKTDWQILTLKSFKCILTSSRDNFEGW